MKTFKIRLFVVLSGILFPLLTANCSEKKSVGKTESAEATAKTESVIQLSTPPFQKFVVVTVEEAALYKQADTDSPWLMRWIESDCESDFCENIYQWSDQPGKAGFEVSTDIMACEGVVYPVLGEEGDFYKVSTTTKWCDVESAYIPKACVGDIESAPIKAEMLESDDMYFKCRVMKEGKYKDITLIDYYDELDGESLQVGVLTNGVVATPLVYTIFCQLDPELKGTSGMKIEETDGHFMLSFSKDLSMPVEEDYEDYQLNLKKLSAEQIETIINTVTKKKPEYVEYMYHLPAQGLQSFVYLTK